MMGHHGLLPMTAGLGVVEVARRIDLQSHGELVEVFGDLMVVIQALIKVDLAIVVQIMQDHQLIATDQVNLFVDHLDPQGLE